MNESEFHERAGQLLLDIENAVEHSGADIEFETAADILTLEFSDGSKIIVNKQAPASQVWVAARSGGFHYGYDPARAVWVDDRTGRELMDALSELASRQAGSPVRLG